MHVKTVGILKTLFYLSAPPGISKIIFLFNTRVTGQKRWRNYNFSAQYVKLKFFTKKSLGIYFSLVR